MKKSPVTFESMFLNWSRRNPNWTAWLAITAAGSSLMAWIVLFTRWGV